MEWIVPMIKAKSKSTWFNWYWFSCNHYQNKSFLKYVTESGYSNHNCDSIKSFDTFYDDYIEYKHYVNDILQNYQF